MTAPNSDHSVPIRPGPSLFKLIHTAREENRLRLPSDILSIIGQQLHLVVQEQHLAADVAIGTLRFSLLQSHHGHLTRLAACCHNVTVYGVADIEAPEIPGVEFVALEPDVPLCNEWFLVIDSPRFWDALLTQAIPDQQANDLSDHRFEGALTSDERIVNHARLLLSLARRLAASPPYPRNPVANRVGWASVAYKLAAHSDAERLELAACLGEFPEFLEILRHRTAKLETLLLRALITLRHQQDVTAAILYCADNQQLNPLLWNGLCQPVPLDSYVSIPGQALQQRIHVLAPLSLGDPEQTTLPDAHSLVAAPLFIHEQPWGVLAVGHVEYDLFDSPTELSVVGVAALLELLLPSRISRPKTRRAADNPQTPEPGPNATAERIPEPQQPQACAQPLPSPSGSHQTAAAPATPAQPGELPTLFTLFGLPTRELDSHVAIERLDNPDTVLIPQPERSDWSIDALQRRLMKALVAFDQKSAEALWNEARSLYSLEALCTELLMPVQIALGDGWRRGEVSIAAGHFTSHFVKTKLLAMLNAYADTPSDMLAVIGCAQNEMHDLGVIMVSLFMHWAGFHVIYLGQNIPNGTIIELTRQLRPQVLGLSASTDEAANNVIEVSHSIMRLDSSRPLFIYGGAAFYERPDLRGQIKGQFFSDNIRRTIRQLAQQLRTNRDNSILA